MPPATPSTMLSVRSGRTSRDRLAPRAARIAISLRRASARGRTRLAMLVQAMSRTNATAPVQLLREQMAERRHHAQALEETGGDAGPFDALRTARPGQGDVSGAQRRDRLEAPALVSPVAVVWIRDHAWPAGLGQHRPA